MRAKLTSNPAATVNTILLVLGLLLAMAVPASADELTVANPNLATQGSGPYASYTISGSGTDYTVTVTGENNFVFGDGGTFALNLSSAAGSGTLTGVTSISCLNGTGLTNCALSQTTTTSEDGFGDFNFKLNDGNGFSDYVYSFTFTFSTEHAVTLATLLAPNGDNAEVAGHVALVTNTACTGFAGNTGANQPTGTPDSACSGTSTPEPGSMSLLVCGVLAAAGVFRRTFWR